MEIIKSVEIRKFRSLKSLTHKLDFTDLNIFVGKNDQGKSNVLRALNLFFNGETDRSIRFRFSDDYCYHSNTGKGTKHEIRIDLIIEPPRNRFKHAKPLRWTKHWRPDGSVFEERRYIGSEQELAQRDNVSKWLDKIRYRYIPAIKGQSYFSALMGELHDVLNEAHSSVLSSQGEDFISGIRKVTEDITKDLNEQIGISNTIQVPSDFKQLFSNLDFGVRVNEHTYHLKQRGDGIKIRHIPVILKYMSEQERNISRAGYVKPDTIWGFEEPENNLELRYAFELAKKFKDYSSDIQIFVTTHSPAFYALDQHENDGVNMYYVHQNDDKCTLVSKVSHDKTDELHEIMGLLPLITPYLTKIYGQQKEIEALEVKVGALQDNTSVVVLTEDSDFEALSIYFKGHGCNLDRTEFISYNGVGEIKSAIAIGKYIKSKKPNVDIIIHRDRDYLTDEEIEKLRIKIVACGLHFYVPKGVDVEGEFICPKHINYLYPRVDIDKASLFIEEATDEAEDDSLGRLIDHHFKLINAKSDGAYGKMKEIEGRYLNDKVRYRYGKKVIGLLKSKVQVEVRSNPNFYIYSDFIKNTSLASIFNK
ncbi:ATP-binding protein [Deefgea tanakiae]|uniref:ATP-binding protein n=1 Tax=Deefgea tanakiae TaxID=2865840 RepID=A0ABX8Z5L0_9NEIS|nr:AAA family ATPase [Deefgea tanakiae]QZA76470.1 ATP-binding protein [Deefgea tanakiae]